MLHLFFPPIQLVNFLQVSFLFFSQAQEEKTIEEKTIASEKEIGSRRSEFLPKRSILFLCFPVRQKPARGDFFLLVQEAPPFEVEDFLGR